MKCAFLLALLSLLFVCGHAHDATEPHTHSCACEAEELNFEIDCNNTDAQVAALEQLQTNGCSTDCTSAVCERNYLIVQSHHDYCPEGMVPQEVGIEFHDYDESCTSCEILRRPLEGAPSCPTVNCADGSGNSAYNAMVAAGCASDCSSAACRDNYQILRAVHDTCPDDALSTAAEDGLHELETPCANHVCNSGGVDGQLVCMDDHDHDEDEHDHDHSCACEADELGFEINCDDTATMLAALQQLQTLGCSTDCSSVECEKNFLIVQSHHDYCPEDKVPEDVEDGFHNYDESCTACEILRMAVEGAPSCPAVDCEDGSGNNAYAALLDNGCNTNCSSTTCRDNYFILRAVHDTCPHDSLSRAAEEGIHDLEIPCAEQICNVAGSEDQLTCSETESSSSSSLSSVLAVKIIVAVGASLVAVTTISI